MKKIKITKEQKEALESYKVFIRELKTDHIQYFVDNFKYWQTEFKPLQTFTPDQFALLLCGWYEVEQPFKVGDWTYNKVNKLYKKVSSKCMSDFWENNEVGLSFVLTNTEILEKVTEPWKIMLLELGRDKPEFKTGDIIVRINGSFSKYNNSMFNYLAENNDIKYFYPVESRIEVKQ